jgi:hypothetical protein
MTTQKDLRKETSPNRQKSNTKTGDKQQHNKRKNFSEGKKSGQQMFPR